MMASAVGSSVDFGQEGAGDYGVATGWCSASRRSLLPVVRHPGTIERPLPASLPTWLWLFYELLRHTRIQQDLINLSTMFAFAK